MIFGSSRSTILTINTLTNPSKPLHKSHLNLCTKLLPEKCINSINHARNRFYLHNQSHKIIVTFFFIITIPLTILPTKLVTPYIEGSQQRHAQKYINYKKPLTNTKENNNYLFSLITSKQAIYCAV